MTLEGHLATQPVVSRARPPLGRHSPLPPCIRASAGMQRPPCCVVTDLTSERACPAGCEGAEPLLRSGTARTDPYWEGKALGWEVDEGT